MTELILHLITVGGYWGIALLMVLENIFPPVPSEVIMGFGGIAVAHGHFGFWPLLLVGTAGAVAGNYCWYLVGRRLGYERLKPLIDRWGRWLTLDWHDVERLNRFFEAHGGKTVLVFRVLPTFRTMISLPAGLMRVPTWKFLAMTAIGTGIWNAVLIYAGIVLGRNFERLEHFTGPVAIALTLLAVGWYLYRVATWQRR